jgi:hypothetical protein
MTEERTFDLSDVRDPTEEERAALRRLRALEVSNPNIYDRGRGSTLFLGTDLEGFGTSELDPNARPNYNGPTGTDTPREEYRDRSGLNDAVRSGGRTPELRSTAAIPGMNTSCESPRQGRYGQIQVTETAGGHRIILNDTMGSESIMIEHSSGSGIEFRPDGSILITGTQIHYNVRGNANFVIEGNANFRSDGNMNFDAGGGMNFNASGAILMNTPGSVVQDIGGDMTTAIGGHSNSVVGGAYTSTIMGERNETNLGGMSMNTQGDMTLRADGDGGIFTSGNLNMTSQGRAMMSSPSVSITGSRLEVVGSTGTMGGEGVMSYSLNSFVGQSLQAGKTVSAQSITASRTLQTHSVFAQYMDTHTIEGIRGNINTIEANHVDVDHAIIGLAETTRTNATSMHATSFHGDLIGTADQAVTTGGSTTSSTATPDTTTPEDAIEEEAPIAADLRRTFVPTHQIIQDRQRGLGNGVRRVRVDPGNYIRNYMDRTVATGGNPTQIVDRTPALPASAGGGTVAQPGGTPVPRQPTATPSPRIPAAPHTAAPGTSARIVEDLQGRDPALARQAVDFINNSRTIETAGAEAQWVPLEFDGRLWLVTADYLRNEDGTYFRSTENEGQQIANRFNAKLPWPAFIDAIWTAAGTQGLQVHAITTDDLATHYQYSPPLDNNAANRERLIREFNEHPLIASQSAGSSTLRAGHLKSIAVSAENSSTLGIYGWRRRNGSLIQPFFSGHGGDYYDYSHGLRLVKELEE